MKHTGEKQAEGSKKNRYKREYKVIEQREK